MSTYTIGRAIAKFRDAHKYIYIAVLTVFVMVNIVVGIVIGLFPIALTVILDSGWFLLLYFILIPAFIVYLNFLEDCF
jgi:hypothetical protein